MTSLFILQITHIIYNGGQSLVKGFHQTQCLFFTIAIQAFAYKEVAHITTLIYLDNNGCFRANIVFLRLL